MQSRNYSTASSPCPDPKNPKGKPWPRLARKRLTKEQKDAIVFTPEIKNQRTNYKMLISDGHIRIMGKGARLELRLKDKEFILIIWNKFDSIGIVGASPREYYHFYQRYGPSYTILSF